ncbi:MAG: ATP-grasp domain-containing protein, partial [Rhodospirillaceae bacterium]|nr:ATP-grasp domain-containing protein [Rhodospirillaceae bacterium]
MFGSVLIANRGEIACRIVRTCRRLGIRAIAVYSDADADALHVRLADAAFRIGPAPARESYLNINAVIAAAKASGAEAVHPGYGFLAENAALADACADAGLVFVGPSADVIRAMGEKHSARALVASAGLPVVPGYHEAGQNPAALERAAARLGFPLVIKAAAGGGGRGMRIVERAEDFAAAAAAARREARSAFGDDRLILERFLARARHIEAQVFGDRPGNVVHLFERDCSLQRRYQKIVEETPAPGLDAATRAHLWAVATAAAKTVGYVGAGTVEMLVVGGDVYFMEMNTRLQV